MRPNITAITISVDLGNKNYGDGDSCFMNMSAKYPEDGKPIEFLGDVVEDGLEMFLKVWETVLGQRTAAGLSKYEEFKVQHEKILKRFAIVKKYLREEETQPNE